MKKSLFLLCLLLASLSISAKDVISNFEDGETSVISAMWGNPNMQETGPIIVDNPYKVGLNMSDKVLNAPIYNILGQRVINPEKGFYIQNGKVILVK